ncbi:MAG: sensor histidine kinase [Bacteroidia bacterium]
MVYLSPVLIETLPEDVLGLLEALVVPITVFSQTGECLLQNESWENQCNALPSAHPKEIFEQKDYLLLLAAFSHLEKGKKESLHLKLAQPLQNQTHVKLSLSFYKEFILLSWLELFTHLPEHFINLQDVIDTSKDGIFALDTDYNFIAFNDTVRRSHSKRFGLEIYLGKPFFQGVPRSFEQKIRPHFDQGMKEQPYSFRFTQHTMNENEQITIESHIYTIKNQEGGIRGICVVGHNISEIIRIQQALTVSQQQLQSIIASVDNKVFVFNEKHEFVNVWARDESTLFFPKEEIIGKPLREVFAKNTPDFVTLYEKTLQQVLETGESITIEYASPVPHDQGYYSTTMTLIRENGVPTRNVAVGVRDITAKKRAEDEKAQLLEDVMLKNRNLEQFTYIVSHNLRSPLARVIGLTSILDKENPASTFNQSILEKLLGECHHIDQVLTDLNTILNIQKNTQEISEKVNLNEAFYHVFEATSPEFFKGENANGLDLQVNFEEAPMIWAIKGYLHSIFHNLISNAIKYRNHEKTLIIQCFSTLSMHNNMVTIVFSDNGIGIDEQHIKSKLFGLYQRFHSHVSGKGLGLHITKAQIEMMGGNIEVKSKVNEGTTFYISLPNSPSPL